MSSLPIIPLVAPWESSEDYTARCVDNRLGGGFSGRDRDGLNGVSSTWNIQLNTQKYMEIDAFLISREGRKPFEFRFDGVTPYRKAYICKQWTWTWLGEAVWGLEATFEEVFRPANSV
jgi:phage-related protein